MFCYLFSFPLRFFFVSHVAAMPVPIAHYDGKGALNMRLNRPNSHF